MSDWIRLTLIFPPALEETITEFLANQPGSPAFTLLHGEGHGSDFARASTAERVRGRVQRCLLWLILERGQGTELLQQLKTHCGNPAIHWWSEPVINHGRLA